MAAKLWTVGEYVYLWDKLFYLIGHEPVWLWPSCSWGPADYAGIVLRIIGVLWNL